jgi:hypothetical protein
MTMLKRLEELPERPRVTDLLARIPSDFADRPDTAWNIWRNI